MRFSIRFLLFLLILAAVGALIIADRNKLQTNIKKLEAEKNQLQETKRAAELALIKEKLAHQVTMAEMLSDEHRQKVFEYELRIRKVENLQQELEASALKPETSE